MPSLNLEPKPMRFAKKCKEQIIREFSPTFCFASDEYIFPTSPEEYAKDVLVAKMRHYENLIKKRKFLNKDQTEEYDLIKKNFFNNGTSDDNFNINGFRAKAVKDYLDYEVLAERRHAAKRSVDDLLTFNEKKHGYALGSQVPIKGHAPNKRNEVDAPMQVSYIPTEDGAIIRYECLYALSGAIPGTNWLYKLLPEEISKLFDHFAVHWGDLEGVYIKVKIDDNGKATFDHMQTFAHGRSGARKVEAKNIHFKNGSPCVYVGSATHPSYTDNFVGRNKFFDKVGDAYTLKLKEFVDLSPEVEKPAWAVCKLWGKADLMTSKSDYVTSGQEYNDKQTPKDWLKYNYHPISENRFFRALTSGFKKIVNKLFGRTEETILNPTEIHLGQLDKPDGSDLPDKTTFHPKEKEGTIQKRPDKSSSMPSFRTHQEKQTEISQPSNAASHGPSKEKSKKNR